MPSAETPPRDPDTLCALRQLARIAEVGMDILEIEAVQVRAKDADVIAHAAAYDRLSRALRLTLRLRLRIARDGLDGAFAEDAARRPVTGREAARPERAQREPEPLERLEREPLLDRERGDRFETMTVGETLVAIQHGLGLAEPIDLTARNVAPASDVAAMLDRAIGRRPSPPSPRLGAAFDAQVQALKPKQPP